VRRQLDKKDEPQTSDWVWAPTLPAEQVPAGRCVGFGHQRWDIENHGCNELVNGWHADPVLTHHPNAIECFLLMTFLAHILFHAFLLSQRETRASGGQVQSLLGKIDGRRDLHRLQPRRPVALNRTEPPVPPFLDCPVFQLSNCVQVGTWAEACQSLPPGHLCSHFSPKANLPCRP